MIKQFINEAISLAQQSIDTEQGGPFGAVIVKDNKIIGRGYNQVVQYNDPTAHAEMEAIREACQTIENFSLKGCTLYASSEPCPMCLSAIYWARIDCVIYANTYEQAATIGFDDQFIYKELNQPHADKQISISQIKDKSILKRSLDVFKAWKNLPIRKRY